MKMSRKEHALQGEEMLSGLRQRGGQIWGVGPHWGQEIPLWPAGQHSFLVKASGATAAPGQEGREGSSISEAAGWR